ncbi:hypothetical protein C0995_007490 [Termitomyces sp. Mi166|nr:hypothetical protein C0995_007490 [Termitomyces sp. Mi166\
MAEKPKSKVAYVRLGNSGLKVSRIILGTMQYGSSKWQEWVLGEEEAIKHIKFARSTPPTYITHSSTLVLVLTIPAQAYSNGLSELILGRAIKQLQLPREEIVILTKVNPILQDDFEIHLLIHGQVYFTVARETGTNLFATGEKPEDVGYVNQHGLSRKHIFDSVKASLARLGVDYIDVLQCHRFDYETPIEETMQALHDVVKAGTDYAIAHNLTPFISMQNHHSVLYREEEREMFPTLKLFGVGSIPWSPLARGLLTRPMKEQTKRGETDRFLRQYLKAPGTSEIVRRVEELAHKKSLSMAQIAVMWSLSKEGVTAPIVGTTSMKNLEELIAVAHMKLTDEEVKYLDEPYVAQAVIGHS